MVAASDIEEREEGSEAKDKATIDCVRELEPVELQSRYVRSDWSAASDKCPKQPTVPVPVAGTPLLASLAGRGNRL